jgi:hypothetical protein
VNSYGIGHGTYLIGQNGSHPETAISFHHSTNMMNRKEIVGWNFKAGDMVTAGYNFSEEMIYFRLRKEKNKSQEFMMALTTEDSKDK